MEIPNHYSLVKEHGDHFEIHDKRDGKKFQVAKKQLHPANQIKVMKMKKMAEGGEAEEVGADGPEEGAFNAPPAALAADQASAQPAVDLSVPTSMEPQQHGGATGSWEEAPAAPAETPQASPAQPQAANFPTSSEVQGAQKQQIEGVEKESTAQQKQNEAMAAQYQKNLAEEQKMFNMHQQKLTQYQAQYDKMVADVASQKIDPDHYMHNKSTASKIMAGIGIALGGIGSGLTHQPNAALQVINKNIENDIESQKANLGIKQSLLSHNLRAQGNMMTAMNSTRLQMAAMAQGKLQLIAAQTGNPLIAARAQQHAAALTQQFMPLRSQVASNEIQMQMRKDIQQRLAGQGQPGSQPVDMQDLARAGFVNPQTAEKEGDAISKRQQAEAYLIDQVKQLDQEQQVWGGKESGNTLPNAVSPSSYAKRDQLRAGIIQAIQSASASKRLNSEMLAIEAEPFLTKTLDSQTTRAAGLRGLLGLLRSHADPTPMASHYKIPGAINGSNTIMKKFEMGPVK